MKKFLAILMSLCLLIPCFSGVVAQVAAEEEKTANFIIKELSPYVSSGIDLTGSGVLLTTPAASFDAMDLSGNGAYDFEQVGIMFDTYLSGSDGFLDYMSNGRFSGQFEITSSGTCDKQEWRCNPGAVVKFMPNTWMRVIVPLTAFSGSSADDFNKTNFNYIRLYLQGGGRPGESGMVKIINWALVDLSVPEEDRPTTVERPLGDNTFKPDPPVFRKIEMGAGYEDSVTQFAGYNLREYLDTHPEVRTVDNQGNTDYTAVINSLLDGLNMAGGGALFIPAGEWDCRGNLVLPTGTAIIGEWVNPDDSPVIRGTILKVYAGAGAIEGTPFVNMMYHTQIRNVAFWYPEQTVDSFTQYPPTISTNQYTFVENVTLVNSYFGIQNNRGANCPNAWNVYGTPLSTGLDFDHVIDIARVQELHFAAKYWMYSGLPGAPTTAEDVQKLEDQLYNYAVGITLRRIDWSYVTYSDIVGYNIGLLFALSTNGTSHPNGQCVGLNFVNCKYGHMSYGVSHESMLEITMKNCEYGIYSTGATAALQYYNSDIQATQYALYQDGASARVTLMASTVRGGRIFTKAGNNIIVNNKIQTAAPQVELHYGTVSGILLGNVDAYGDPIEYANPGRCTMSYEEDKVDLKPYTPMTREEANGIIKAPASDNYLIPINLDNVGLTDVTEQIQAYLTALAENGGGILFLQPGKYRIDGTFTIPTGVELRGAADYASIPKAVNTILCVYTPIEEGKDEYTSTATITMEENSGIRGIIVNYPLQNSRFRQIDQVVDPVKSKEATDAAQKAENQAAAAEGREPVAVDPVQVFAKYYEFDFEPYPYTIRGTGADIYIVNVSIRNGWNGVDFKTYRCDNHYIDYLAGHFFNRGIIIGAGAKNGYVRNFQFNYNSIYQAAGDVWAGFGGEPAASGVASYFHQPMQAQFNNNSIILQLGHVEDQLVYNCFNYAGYIGVHLIEENGRAADARIFGHGVDYGTQSVKIEAAEHVEFTNMQLTSFNQCGSDGNTKRYAVDQSKTPLYDIWLTDTFEGEITITNFNEWAPSPTAGVRVDSGKLNMYNAQYSHTVAHLFELNGDGKLNIVGFHSTRADNPKLVDDDPENLTITAGYYVSELQNTEGVSAMDHVYLRKTRYAVPENVVFADDSEIIFAESFDTYTFTNSSQMQVDNLNAVSMRRGAVRLRLNAGMYALSLKAGQTRGQAKPFALESGKSNDLYRMEWRFNVAEMRNTEYSEVSLYISNQDIRNTNVITITKDGAVKLADGSRLSTVQFGTFYRIAVEVDARKADAKTMTVYLMDDNGAVMAKSTATALPKNFQGEDNTVTGFWFVAMADMLDYPETETDLQIDYFYICRSEDTTFTASTGDVNSDGKIDSTDARLVLQYAVGKIGTLGAETAADVNRDKKIDSTDARLILQYAVGKISGF